MNLTFVLAGLLAIAVLGQSIFAVFEVETPAWRKVLKWSVIVGLTLALSQVVGDWSILLPLGAGLLGAIGHFVWCWRNGIDPIRATPRRKYYELRGWTWLE